MPEAMHPHSTIVAEHMARYQWAAERVAELGGHQVVLDAPCGAGYGTVLLASAPNVAIAMGVDIDSEAIAYARDRFGMPGRVVYSTGDLLQLRARANVVVCFEGIEHVDDQPAAAQALCAALKPGGLLLVSTPRADGPGAGSPYHTHELGLDELVDLFAPRLDRVTVHGQDVLVSDEVPVEQAKYFILEGVKAA